jgi:hypothetical protein
MATLRYTCPVADYPEDFVEVSEAWSRRDFRTFWLSEEGDPILDIYRRKIVACHLSRADGQPPLTDPATLNEEAIDSLDMRIFMWLQGAMLQAATEVQTLGKAAQRRLFEPSADTAAPGS